MDLDAALLTEGTVLLVGVVSGFLSILAGGGVTVVLPVLLALGLAADVANATSRLGLAAGTLVAALSLARAGRIDWPVARPMIVAAAAGAALGALAGATVRAPAMLEIIVVTAVVSTILVFAQPNRWLAAAPQRPLVPPAVGVGLYFALCVYGGVVAVDSAILRLILLVLVVGLPLGRANPVKVVSGLALFGVSALVYAKAGEVDWRIAAWLSAGTVVGAYAAARLSASPAAQVLVYRLLQAIVALETSFLVLQWLGVVGRF